MRQWRDATQDPRGVVLLIHGFPEHSLLYDKLASRLAFDGFIVYAPDLRGLGRAYADEIATKIEYAKHADNDVARLAERIRKEHKGLKLIAGGESMGGALAIRLAATRPDLVDGVILSGPALKLEHHYARLIPRSLVNVLTLGAVQIALTGTNGSWGIALGLAMLGGGLGLATPGLQASALEAVAPHPWRWPMP